MAAIFIASSISDPPVPPDVPDVDLHAAAYFGLMLLVVRALARGTLGARHAARAARGAWLITVVYGATDEWHQSFVPNRHAELARPRRRRDRRVRRAESLVKAWGIIRRL